MTKKINFTIKTQKCFEGVVKFVSSKLGLVSLGQRTKRVRGFVIQSNKTDRLDGRTDRKMTPIFNIVTLFTVLKYFVI